MKTQTENKIITQVLATLGVSFLTTEIGITDGWTSPNVARLTAANSTIPLTLSEASWLGSYHKLGVFMSAIPMPVLLDLAGSKRTVLYSFIPISVSWILIMTAKSATPLYVAVFLNGIALGLTYGCFPLYLGEISAPTLRGTFIAIAAIGCPLGILIGSAGETHLPEVVSCSIYLVPCILGILLFLWLPESPYRLVKNKKMEEARESLIWYRGRKNTDSAMDEIVEYIESTKTANLTEKLRQFKLPPVRKAVLLVTLVFLCPQVSGVFNIVYYMQIILTDAKSHLIEPSDAVVYLNALFVVSAVVTVNLIDKLGRRILLIASGAAIAMGFAGLALHFYLLNNIKVDPTSIQVLPLASIILVMISYANALSPVMNALLGEMFSASVKSTAAVIVMSISSFAGFTSTVAYRPLVDAIGETYVFLLYAVLIAITLPVFFFFLPETKGKSLQEIQNELNKK